MIEHTVESNPAQQSPAAGPAASREQSFLPSIRSSLQHREGELLAAALVALDVILLTACLVAVNWLRPPHSGVVPLHFLLLPIPLMGLCLYLIDGYKPDRDMQSVGYASQHLLAVAIAGVAVLFASYVLLPEWGEVKPRRANIVLSVLLFLPVSLLYRRDISARCRRRTRQKYLLFLGGPAAARKLFRDYCRPRGVENMILATGLEGQDLEPEPGDGEMRYQRLDLPLFRQYEGRVRGVVCAEDVSSYPPELLKAIVNLRFSSVPIHSFESFCEARLGKIPASAIDHSWLLKQGFEIAHDPVYLHIKRFSDIVISGIGLLLAAPLFAAVALLVKLSDGGPIFFRQTRVGLNTQPFTAYKFRSMRVGSETGDRYTQQKDARITPVGAFLRRSRLDELPQLWNVFRGDMSMIGPRAEWDKLVETYEEQISCYHFRHLVKPGITGWAQVNYPYGANLNDTVHKLEYDLYYIRHFSFLLDASIVLKTIHTMLFARGAR